MEINKLELLRTLRETELANLCFESIEKDTPEGINRSTIVKTKKEKLVEAFMEFIELQFDEATSEKIIDAVNKKISEEIKKEPTDKFKVNNTGIYYIDVDMDMIYAEDTLMIDYNWLALIIKPLIDYLRLSSLNYASNTIGNKDKDFFNLMLFGLSNYIRKKYTKALENNNLTKEVEPKLGIYIPDPNFWGIGADSALVHYSIYQELFLAFDVIYLKKEIPDGTNHFFERIVKMFNIKILNYNIFYPNGENILETKKSHSSKDLIFHLWFALKREFNLDANDATKLYLDLIEVKDVVLDYIIKRVSKSSPTLDKQNIVKNIFNEMVYSEYNLIASEFKHFVDLLNSQPNDWRELNDEKNRLNLVLKITDSQILREKLEEINDAINNYSFKKYDCDLYSLGLFFQKEININEVYASFFSDPETKDKDSKSIEEAIKNFDRLYRNRIIGQDHVINPIWSALKKWYIGIRSKKPVGSFLLCGPTGVGKTETAKFLSEELGSFTNLITLDMSEYQSEIDKTKIIGVAPGYSGYDQGAGILDKVATNPRSVILFDEIEKAHPLIFDLLLQLLDEGRLTDHKGNEVSFKECLIICTTNAWYEEIEHLGHNARSEIINVLSNSFRKEFLARFTDILKFNNLGEETLSLIFEKKLEKGLEELIQSSSNPICKIIEDVNFYKIKSDIIGMMDASLGARELERKINEKIIHPIMEDLIKQQLDGLKFNNSQEREYYFDSLGKLKVKGLIEEPELTKMIFPLENFNLSGIIKLDSNTINKLMESWELKNSRYDDNDFDGGNFSGAFDEKLLKVGYIRICVEHKENSSNMICIKKDILDKLIVDNYSELVLDKSNAQYWSEPNSDDNFLESYSNLYDSILKSVGYQTQYIDSTLIISPYVDGIDYILNEMEKIKELEQK